MPERRDRSEKDINSEEDAVKRTTGGGPGGFKGPADKVEVQIDWNKIGRRSRQLTKVADNVGNIAVNPDSKTVVFTTSGTEGGRKVNSIWSISIDGGQPTRVTQEVPPEVEDGAPQLGGFGGGFNSLQFSKDGKTLYYKQGKSIYAAQVASGAGAEVAAGAGGGGGGKGDKGGGAAVTPGTGAGAAGRKIAFTAKVEVDVRAERRQVFLEGWRVMKHRFYDATMHGSDWDKVRQTYEPLLEHVADQEELHNIISMMLGELNASHTGISAGGRRAGGK